MRTLLLPSLVATSLLAPLRARAAGPLDGCVDATMKSDTTSIACDKSRVLVVLSEGDVPRDQQAELADQMVRTNAERFGDTMSAAPDLVVGGKAVPVVALDPKDPAVKAPRGLFVWADTGGGHLRTVLCVAVDGRADARPTCAPLLAEVLANAFAGLTAAPASTIAVLGRQVAVPAGCAPRVEGTKTEVRCAGGVVYSVVSYPDPATRATAPALLRAFEDTTRKDFVGNYAFADVSCRVLDGAGSCRTAHGTANGIVVEQIYAVGAVGSVPVTVYCLAPGADLRTTPCAALVSWD